MLTWHFVAENVRDFAWASSKTYVWDAAGFSYPRRGPGHHGALHVPARRDAAVERDLHPGHDSDPEDVRRMAFEYPYPKAANVNGPAGGMEYPMLAFCGARPQPRRRGAGLFRRCEVRPHDGHHPRGRAQLVPDDRRHRRAEVDLDGRGSQHVSPVLRPDRDGPRRTRAGGDRPPTSSTTCGIPTRCRS